MGHHYKILYIIGGSAIILSLIALFFALQSVGNNLTSQQEYGVFKDLLTIILTIIGAITAVITVTLYQLLTHKVQKDSEEKANKVIKAKIAHFYVTIGYMYWRDYELSRNTAYLEEAIEATQSGIDESKDLDETENEYLLCLLRNNLASYLIERTTKKPEDVRVVEDCIRYVRTKLSKYKEARADFANTIEKANKAFSLNV